MESSDDASAAARSMQPSSSTASTPPLTRPPQWSRQSAPLQQHSSESASTVRQPHMRFGDHAEDVSSSTLSPSVEVSIVDAAPQHEAPAVPRWSTAILDTLLQMTSTSTPPPPHHSGAAVGSERTSAAVVQSSSPSLTGGRTQREHSEASAAAAAAASPSPSPTLRAGGSRKRDPQPQHLPPPLSSSWDQQEEDPSAATPTHMRSTREQTALPTTPPERVIRMPSVTDAASSTPTHTNTDVTLRSFTVHNSGISDAAASTGRDLPPPANARLQARSTPQRSDDHRQLAVQPRSSSVGGLEWEHSFSTHAQQLLRETEKQVEVLRYYQALAAREAAQVQQLTQTQRFLEKQLADAQRVRQEEQSAHNAAVADLSRQVLALDEQVGELRRAKVEQQQHQKGEQHGATERDAAQTQLLRRLTEHFEQQLTTVEREYQQREEAWAQERDALHSQLAQWESMGAVLEAQQSQLEMRCEQLEQQQRQQPRLDAVPCRTDAATSTSAADSTGDAPAVGQQELPLETLTDDLVSTVHSGIIEQQQLREKTLLSQLTMLEARLRQETQQRRVADQRVMDLLLQNDELREAAAAATVSHKAHAPLPTDTNLHLATGEERAVTEAREQEQQRLLREIQAEYEALQYDSAVLFEQHASQRKASMEHWQHVRAALAPLLSFAGVPSEAAVAAAPASAPEEEHRQPWDGIVESLQRVATALQQRQLDEAQHTAQEREQLRLSTLQDALQHANAQTAAHLASLETTEAQLLDARMALGQWHEQQAALARRQREQEEAWRAAEPQLRRVSGMLRRALREYSRRTVMQPADEQATSTSGVALVDVPLATEAHTNDSHEDTSATTIEDAVPDLESVSSASTEQLSTASLVQHIAGLERGLLRLLAAWRTRQHALLESQKKWHTEAVEATATQADAAAQARTREEHYRQQIHMLRSTEQRRLRQLEQVQHEMADQMEQQAMKAQAERAEQAEVFARELETAQQRPRALEEELTRAKRALVDADVRQVSLRKTNAELQEAQRDVAAERDRLRQRQADYNTHIEDLEDRLVENQKQEAGLRAMLSVSLSLLVRALLQLQQLRQQYRVAHVLQHSATQTVSGVEALLLSLAAGEEEDETEGGETRERHSRIRASTKTLPALSVAFCGPPRSTNRLRSTVAAVVAAIRLQHLVQQRRGMRESARAPCASSLFEPLVTALSSCGASVAYGSRRTEIEGHTLPVVRLPPTPDLVAPIMHLLPTVEDEQRDGATARLKGVHFEVHSDAAALSDKPSRTPTSSSTAAAAAQMQMIQHLFSVVQLDVQGGAAHLLHDGVAATALCSSALARLAQQTQWRHAALRETLPQHHKANAGVVLPSATSMLMALLPSPLGQHMERHLSRVHAQRSQLLESKSLVRALMEQNKKLVGTVEQRTRAHEATALRVDALTAQLSDRQPQPAELLSMQGRLVESGATLLQERKLRREAEEQLSKLKDERLRLLGAQEQLKREVYALNMELANSTCCGAGGGGGAPTALSIQREREELSATPPLPSPLASSTRHTHESPQQQPTALRTPPPPLPASPAYDPAVVMSPPSAVPRASHNTSYDAAYYLDLLRGGVDAAADAELLYRPRHNISTAQEPEAQLSPPSHLRTASTTMAAAAAAVLKPPPVRAAPASASHLSEGQHVKRSGSHHVQFSDRRERSTKEARSTVSFATAKSQQRTPLMELFVPSVARHASAVDRSSFTESSSGKQTFEAKSASMHLRSSAKSEVVDVAAPSSATEVVDRVVLNIAPAQTRTTHHRSAAGMKPHAGVEGHGPAVPAFAAAAVPPPPSLFSNGVWSSSAQASSTAGAAQRRVFPPPPSPPPSSTLRPTMPRADSERDDKASRPASVASERQVSNSDTVMKHSVVLPPADCSLPSATSSALRAIPPLTSTNHLQPQQQRQQQSACFEEGAHTPTPASLARPPAVQLSLRPDIATAPPQQPSLELESQSAQSIASGPMYYYTQRSS